MIEVGIFGRSFDEKFAPYIQRFFDKLNELNIQPHIFEPFDEHLNNSIKLDSSHRTFNSHADIVSKVKFLFSIGGDGTLLDATTLVRDSNIPIIGINTGRLGFLSSISINEIDTALHDIFAGNYSLDQRTLLKLESSSNLFGESNFALNELTILKKDTSSMIKIHTYMNDSFLNSYWADGLIIATPTGSTAYSLSCGGPIILSDSNTFEITPIAPHNLNVRPIIIPDDKEITLKVEGRTDQFLLSLDSRSETIDSSVKLKISKNNFTINLVRLSSEDTLNTIRTKLNWGLDKRN